MSEVCKDQFLAFYYLILLSMGWRETKPLLIEFTAYACTLT